MNWIDALGKFHPLFPTPEGNQSISRRSPEICTIPMGRRDGEGTNFLAPLLFRGHRKTRTTDVDDGVADRAPRKTFLAEFPSRHKTGVLNLLLK